MGPQQVSNQYQTANQPELNPYDSLNEEKLESAIKIAGGYIKNQEVNDLLQKDRIQYSRSSNKREVETKKEVNTFGRKGEMSFGPAI